MTPILSSIEQLRHFSGDDANNTPSLSDRAKEILVAMASSSDGQMITIDAPNGIVAQIIGKPNIGGATPRERAEIKDTIDELLDHDLIKEDGDSAYSVTNKGYKVYDALINNGASDT